MVLLRTMEIFFILVVVVGIVDIGMSNSSNYILEMGLFYGI